MILTVLSCEYEGDSFNVSQETIFPTFEMQGDPIVIIPVGQAYTDEGADAFEGTAPIDVNITGSVDVNTPGLYQITYTAVNGDGYEASVVRGVAVCTQAALNADLSGNYQRNAGARGVSSWILIEPGMYRCVDVGGARLPNDWVYLFNVDENIVVVPVQPLGGLGTTVTCTNADGGAEIEYIPGAVDEVAYRWIVLNGGYGTAVRSFVRVE